MEFGFLKEYARRGENPRRAYSVECCMASAFSLGKWGYINYNDIRLSLDTTGTVSASQLEYFVHGYHVEVSFD